MNIDKVGLRKAWINYYIKEYQQEENVAIKRAEIKMKELEDPSNKDKNLQ